MYKIGIIGERDSILGFMSLGFSVHEAQDVNEARTILHSMVKSSEYAIIFLLENYAAQLEEDCAKYRDLPLPAIITIPGQTGNTGYGLASIKNAVERAVGTDIIFKDN